MSQRGSYSGGQWWVERRVGRAVHTPHPDDPKRAACGAKSYALAFTSPVDPVDCKRCLKLASPQDKTDG